MVSRRSKQKKHPNTKISGGFLKNTAKDSPIATLAIQQSVIKPIEVPVDNPSIKKIEISKFDKPNPFYQTEYIPRIITGDINIIKGMINLSDIII